MSPQQIQQTVTHKLSAKSDAERDATKAAKIAEEKRLGKEITQHDQQMLRIYANQATDDDLRLIQTSTVEGKVPLPTTVTQIGGASADHDYSSARRLRNNTTMHQRIVHRPLKTTIARQTNHLISTNISKTNTKTTTNQRHTNSQQRCL